MNIILHDKSGMKIGTIDIPTERIGNVGVISWIDAFFTFWNYNDGILHFIQVDILALDDEEVKT